MEMTLTDDELRTPASDAAVVARIVSAVMEQKLCAGAKLPEAALCDAFECSRSQIRRILVVLTERGVVTLRANRGAFISSPKTAEAREVFEARVAIERSIAMSAARHATPQILAELRANVAAGARAEIAGERGESIGLSGQFHLRLAEIAGNSVLAKLLEDLVARTSLILGLYGARNGRSCSEEGHLELVEALATRDPQRAAEAMERHLLHVEAELDMSERIEEAPDLRVLFGRAP
jgi:DNA-binding GntR family transcriptional regulator